MTRRLDHQSGPSHRALDGSETQTVRGGSTRRRRRLERVAAALILVSIVCLTAVWTAPRASGAVAEWIRTPPVQVRTLELPRQGDLRVIPHTAVAQSSSMTLDASMRFTMLGVTCDVPAREGPVVLLLRTSLDGSTWTPWVETPLEVADEEGVAPIGFTDPLWTGAARYAQVSAVAAGSGAPPGLTGTQLVAIDPTEDAGGVAGLSDAVRRVAASVAGVSLAPPASAATGDPAIITRAEWGANESWRSGSPTYATVRMAFVHHTASGNTYSREDSAALMRGIYAYHTKTLGWSDIGYNFLVDRYGSIYEGRYGGVNKGVVGAQVLGFNTGSTGISVMGTFSSEPPPAAVLTALKQILTWKLATHGLDPGGTARLTCGSTEKFTKGSRVTLPVIAGHRDANHTECPGSSLYALLPGIRTDVARRLQTAVTAGLAVSASTISPNGDGRLDETVIQATVNTAADWALTLRSESGATVASWSGQGTSAEVTWNGAVRDGRTVPDGVYTAELTASSALGDAIPATAFITVDTVAPRLSSVAGAPDSFSPNGDDQSETAAVTYSPAESCAVRVGIQDENALVRRWLHGWRKRGTGSSTVTWDGLLVHGGKMVAAADGPYKFVVERRDDAGNIARKGCGVVVDTTLGFPAATPVTFSPNGDGCRDSTRLRFTLGRRATVSVIVRVGSETVRTIELGSLGKGTRTTVFNGQDASGEALPSGQATFTVIATSSVGDSSVSKSLVIDNQRPRLFATRAKIVQRGRTARLGFRAHDPYSARVFVHYTIVDARGRLVASTRLGWVRSGKGVAVTWRSNVSGTYTITYRATDQACNREAKVAITKLTVR